MALSRTGTVELRRVRAAGSRAPVAAAALDDALSRAPHRCGHHDGEALESLHVCGDADGGHASPLSVVGLVHGCLCGRPTAADDATWLDRRACPAVARGTNGGGGLEARGASCPALSLEP